MVKNKIEKRINRLLIRIVDKDVPPTKELSRTGELTGNTTYQTKWVEVKEVNLGSIKFPNKEVIEFRIEPIRVEPEEREYKPKSFKDMFDGVF